MFLSFMCFLILITGGYIEATKKNIYIYFKTNDNPAYYYLDKDNFYKELFGQEYTVTLVRTLKGLKDYTYIITEEVPFDDQELRYLLSYPKNQVLLFSFEPPLSQTRSQKVEYHHYYGKIFTWNDELIDNKKYFKVHYPWSDPRPIISDCVSFESKKLCTFVGGYNWFEGNPYSNHPERHSIIEFLEKYHSNEFDLYGPGWQVFKFKCYKGPIVRTGDYLGSKIQVLKHYKFDLAYENSRGLNGYVSERIFNAFSAGCVPVYSGSGNITEYVPKECFIDRRDFTSNQELYDYLSMMSKERYEEYLHHIKKYLASEVPWQLTTRYYMKHIRSVLHIQGEV